MADNEKMSVPQYAKYRGISRQMVYKYVNQGKLAAAVVNIGGKTRIDPHQADVELAANLDQVYNRPRTRTAAPLPDGLALQDQAVDIATDAPGFDDAPWPLWAARYIGALAELDPDRVEITQAGSEWLIVVRDLHTETGEHIPWSVRMIFDFTNE